MKIKTFKVERWMNDYEDEAVYNLGETFIILNFVKVERS